MPSPPHGTFPGGISWAFLGKFITLNPHHHGRIALSSPECCMFQMHPCLPAYGTSAAPPSIDSETTLSTAWSPHNIASNQCRHFATKDVPVGSHMSPHQEAAGLWESWRSLPEGSFRTPSGGQYLLRLECWPAKCVTGIKLMTEYGAISPLCRIHRFENQQQTPDVSATPLTPSYRSLSFPPSHLRPCGSLQVLASRKECKYGFHYWTLRVCSLPRGLSTH